MSNKFNEYGVNIENLKILRGNLIKDKDKINLDMIRYSESEHNNTECGTAACIIGHATRYFKDEFSKVNFSYLRFSEEVFCEDDYSTWGFLFGSDWSNDLNEAIARINLVIENGKCPDKWRFKDQFAN